MAGQPKCPISGEPMHAVFSEIILRKHAVTYYYCPACGLLKTENPFWLAEAYQEAIADTDTGLANRNIDNSARLETILAGLALEHGAFLDVAGGYGLLTRLLRDKGFDCYTSDKYCQNLFAKSFEPDDNFAADALFAFEVMEHIEDPLQFVQDLFQKYHCRTLIFSTLTFANEIPPKDWWYYSFDTGQHITFYQARTLALLADRLACKYYRIDAGFHIITDREISAARRALLFNSFVRKQYARYVRRKRKGLSKTLADSLKMKEQPKTS